jgi:hypothetical protein
MKYDMELVDGLRALSPEEFKELESSCIEHGILDPVKIWEGYLIDGRHRLRISDKHKLVYKTQDMEFADKEEARLWVLKNQLGKRNLTEIEVQRARAELAKATSVEEAARETGVSERTIQRDVEASEIMEMMPKDLRKKCETGEIINSRSDWKRYSELSDDEREATNQKLRANPELSMRAAMPTKKHDLTPEQLSAINGIPAFDHNIRRMIAAGTIQVDAASIKKAIDLTADRQELLAVILTDPGVDSLKKALHVLSGTAAPRSTQESIRIAVSSVVQLVDRIEERMKDLRAVGVEPAECERLIRLFSSEISKLEKNNGL